MGDALSARVASILISVLGIDAAQGRLLSQESVPQWDSLAHLNLILALQDEFGVAFTEQEMVAMTSAETIEDVLRRRGISA